MWKRFKIKLTHLARQVNFPGLKDQCDIDVLGINGDYVVAFEAKTSIDIGDIEHFRSHVLSRFYKLLPEYKGRKLYAGVAYIRARDGFDDEDIIKHAEHRGLLVIKVIGKSSRIVNTKGFRLRNYRSPS